MAKENERKLAKKLYMQGRTGKEIAGIVKTQEKTISAWVKKYHWKAEREARVNSSNQELSNLRTIMADLTEDKIKNMRDQELARKAKDQDKLTMLRGEARQISDNYSKWNKRLREIEDNNKVPLATYIQVMEELFKSMQKYDPELFMQTLDFQEKHLDNVCANLDLN